MPGMISVAEAQRRLIDGTKPVGSSQIPLKQSLGRVLSEDIRSPMDLPPFDNSQMDGYAVISGDVSGASDKNPIQLNVVNDIPAGTFSQIILKKGEAARIMTGAPIPRGADLVIPVEDTDQERITPHNNTGTVQIFKSGKAGHFIRPKGQDIRNQQTVLSKGKHVRPQDIGLLAMLGITRVRVFQKPKIALLSSGDELVAIDRPLQPGQIHDANTYLLQGLLERFRADIIPLGIATDNLESIQAHLDQAIEAHSDLIITSAGVSVGEFDYVRSAIESSGEIEFWRVNVRPGKPIAYGNYKGTPIIGLPGNPVSAFIGFHIFVWPLLENLSGMVAQTRLRIFARTTSQIESDGRESYLRCKVTQEKGETIARLTGAHQGSGNLLSLVEANALLIVPSGVKSLPADSIVEVRLLDI